MARRSRSSAEGSGFFFQVEDGIRDRNVTGVQTCALPISRVRAYSEPAHADDLSGSDHYLYAATYQTTGGFSSTLSLNNTLNHDLSAQVTLFNKHGQAL